MHIRDANHCAVCPFGAVEIVMFVLSKTVLSTLKISKLIVFEQPVFANVFLEVLATLLVKKF